jgi:plasmid stability protein
MKNVTVTMDEKLLERVRIRAAREGKSVSRLMSEAAESLVGRTLTQKEALDDILARPPLSLTVDGRAPSRDDIYD